MTGTHRATPGAAQALGPAQGRGGQEGAVDIGPANVGNWAISAGASRRIQGGSHMAVEEKVKEIIVDQLGVDAAKVVPAARFVEDLGADSLDTVELVMAFEEEFDIEIPDEDAEKIRSVTEATEYVKKKVEAKGA